MVPSAAFTAANGATLPVVPNPVTIRMLPFLSNMLISGFCACGPVPTSGLYTMPAPGHAPSVRSPLYIQQMFWVNQVLMLVRLSPRRHLMFVSGLGSAVLLMLIPAQSSPQPISPAACRGCG